MPRADRRLVTVAFWTNHQREQRGTSGVENTMLTTEIAAHHVGRKSQNAPGSNPVHNVLNQVRKLYSCYLHQRRGLRTDVTGVDCVYDDKRMKGGIKTGVIERLTQRIGT